MSQQQPQQLFSLSDLTGQDIDAIMNGLNELQTKVGRPTMNKLEGQIIQQVVAAQRKAPEAPPEPTKVDPSMAN